MNPTIGRIVLHKNGHGGVFPAIVTGVVEADKGSVNLCIFREHDVHNVSKIEPGDQPGQWSWPVVPAKTP